jgi:hypothetical protein
LKKQAQQLAGEARRHLADARHDKLLHEHHEQVLGLLREQQKEIGRLRHDVRRASSSGGFPWGLVVLAGAGYALYRTRPEVRDRIDDLLARLNPGVQGNVSRGADAVRDAARDVRSGANPTDAFQRAGGEARRAAEKTADGIKDTWNDVKSGARQAADDLTGGDAPGNRGRA